MKRGFNIFLVFVLAVLVSNRVLIDAADESIYNEKNLETDTAANKDIYNPKTVDDKENPNALKRKRKKKNEENNDDLKGIERINANLFFIVCDYLHIDDTSRFHRTSKIIQEKLLVAHASVHEIALRQFMRMVRAPPLNSPLYNTIGRKLAYILVDRNQYQLMKRYQRFVEKNDMSSARMKETMVDIFSTNIPPSLYPITLNARQSTFRYLYLEQTENDFSFEIPYAFFDFAPVPKDNDGEASKLIPHLNYVPLNVLFVFDVWTTMCYLRKPNTKEFTYFRYDMPAFFTTGADSYDWIRRSRYPEHYIHFWNHKIDTIAKFEDDDIFALALVRDKRSFITIGFKSLYVIIQHYYWNKDTQIYEKFYERRENTIYFPDFNSEE